jgi:peptide/nickel transport system ATP-binding protein
LEVRRGETLGIIGESGSGKSTLLRTIAGLLPPLSGTIEFCGQELAPTVSSRPRATRGDVQLVFQNPDSSLNPRQTVRTILTRPIRLFRDRMSRSEENAEVERLLDSVQLQSAVLERFPSELSGGQKQRIAIARAFATRPAVLLCDEITSALDVSVQASILELLSNLSAKHRAATIFVSHDLAVIRMLADRTMVMRNGIVVESGPTADVFLAPRNDYTRALLAAVHDLPGREVPATR